MDIDLNTSLHEGTDEDPGVSFPHCLFIWETPYQMMAKEILVNAK